MKKNMDLHTFIKMNLSVLDRLYDEKLGAFNRKIYAYNKLVPLVKPFGRFGVIPFHFIHLPRLYESIKMDPTKDLKHIGHGCVGFLYYIIMLGEKHRDYQAYQNKVKSCIRFLSSYQDPEGYLRCRYVPTNHQEMGTDFRSIAESTNAFLWAAQIACNLNLFKERVINERIDSALKWLLNNKKFLIPQEKARLVYALAQVYGLRNDRDLLVSMESIGQDLISELTHYRSFSYFSDNIDAVGALSILYLFTKNPLFRDFSRRLVHNLIKTQGSEGTWRWRFRRSNGKYIPLLDVTYTVHQLGMAPFTLTLYLSICNINDLSYVAESIQKVILWVAEKRAFTEHFIIRSFSGLSGAIFEFEQRSYEPGLNILGLLSYNLFKHNEKLDPLNLIFPWAVDKKVILPSRRFYR